MIHQGRWLLLAAGLLLGGLSAAAGLPRPEGLEPEIAFWRSVFAETSTTQYLVHDSRHLGVVYETLELGSDPSDAERRRRTEQVRSKYARLLKELATGKREGLTSDERRVLAAWPEDVSNAELREAAGRVRTQQGLSDRFLAGLVRSGRWREHIRENLRAHGVPDELQALPHVESSYNPEARSFVGAAGLWQFTRGTGQRFMRIDHIVDERRDPFRSSEAAAQLLQYNYSILGSWPLAITAYNHGLAGMRRAKKRMGTDDIETIVRRYDGPAFGFASRNFYVAFLAAAEIDRQAEKYFGSYRPDPPEHDLLVVLPDYLRAETLAEAFGVSLATLRRWNPALLDPVWQGSKYAPKGYALRFPADAAAGAPAAVLAAIPAEQRFTRQVPDVSHRVARGESLSTIARRYGTSVSTLVALNGLPNRHRIRAGQELRLPGGQAPSAVASAASARPAPATGESYVVRRGDTLSGIARRAGTSPEALLALNGLPSADRIYAGQRLRLSAPPEPAAADAEPPAGESASVVAAATDAAPVAPGTELSLETAVGDAAERDAESVAGSAGELTEAASADAGEVPAAATASAAGPASTAGVDEALPVAAEAGSAADSPARPPDMLADPSDYLVAEDGTIEVQAAETLGHYADWLGIPTQQLRTLNGMRYGDPLIIGRRIRLPVEPAGVDAFVARRLAHHRDLQEDFFKRYRVADTTPHELRSGESVWVLAQRRYNVPVWLLRQYNPDLDLSRVHPGMLIVFPKLEPADGDVDNRPQLADAA